MWYYLYTSCNSIYHFMNYIDICIYSENNLKVFMPYVYILYTFHTRFLFGWYNLQDDTWFIACQNDGYRYITKFMQLGISEFLSVVFKPHRLHSFPLACCICCMCNVFISHHKFNTLLTDGIFISKLQGSVKKLSLIHI